MPDLLRETFEAYALRAPSADGLREAVGERLRASRRRRWTAVSAAAAVAVVVAGAGVVATREGARPGVTTPVPEARTPLAAMPPAPEGMTWFTQRGVEVMVPEAWLSPTFDACGEPQSSAVIATVTPSEGGCAGYPKPGIDVVSFTVREAYEVEGLTQVERTTVSGFPARRLTGRSQPRDPVNAQHAEALDILERDTVVLVTTDDPALADRVLDSVRVTVGRDSLGCEIRRDAFWTDAQPAREDARETLVPGTPVQASVCRYGTRNGWVFLSRLVTDDVAALAAALNAAGRAEEPPTAPSASPGGSSAFTVTFRYAEGPDVTVFVRRHGDDEGGDATNGAVHTTDAAALEKVLRPLVGWRHPYDETRDWFRP